MRIVCSLLACAMLLTHTAESRADETTDKLDLILKEIRSLSERVRRLEQHMLPKPDQKRAPSSRQIRSRVIVPLRQSPVTAKEVIRLQSESPSSLMKGIHERERQLRQRIFPPDVIPYSPR